MEDLLERAIREASQEISQLTAESNVIAETDKSLPQNLQQFIEVNNHKEQLTSLNSLLDSLKAIDSIKASKGRLIQSLIDCKSIFMASTDHLCVISNETKVKIFNDILSSNKGQVEAALQKIKFPIFDGFLLRPIIDQMKLDNSNEINLLTSYFSLISYLPIQQAKPLNEIDDEVSALVYKKISASIIVPYRKSLNFPNQSNTEGIGDIFDHIKSYLMKSFHNLNEFLSLSAYQMNPSLDSTSNAMMIFFIERTFHLLNASFNESSALKEQIEGSVIELIQRTAPLNNELYKVYSYDVLQHESFNLLIRQSAKDQIDTLIASQKGFCDTIISSTLASKIHSEIAEEGYNTEDLVDLLKLIIKDNMCFFTVFQETKVIEDNVIFLFKKIFLIFDGYFLNDFREHLGEPRYVFLFNLLYSFLDLFNRFYSSFEKRVYSIDSTVKDRASQKFIAYSKSLIELIDWYTSSLRKLYSFDEVIALIKAETLTSLTKKQVEGVFLNAGKALKSLFDAIDKVKPMPKVEELLCSIIFKEFCNNTIEKLDTLLSKGCKGKESDLLAIKVKDFIALLANRDGLSSAAMKGFDKYVRDINKLLASLTKLK